jgi:hypothetical protein
MNEYIPAYPDPEYGFDFPAQLVGTPASPILQLLNKSGVPVEGDTQPGAIFPFCVVVYEPGHL